MGSLNSSDVPVVSKVNRTYRKRDVLITQTDAANDSVSNIVDNPVVRTISSGSLVRSDGSVVYTEDVAWGTTRLGRTSRERIASKEGALREILVTLPEGSGTIAVIPDSLSTPELPNISMRHLGNTVVHGDSYNDLVVSRLPDSGVFDTGFPL